MYTYGSLYESFCSEKIRKYSVYADFYKKTGNDWVFSTTVSSNENDIVFGKSIVSLKIVKGLTSGSFNVGKCLNSELTLSLYTGAFRLEQNQKWKIVIKVSFTGIWGLDAEQQVRESELVELGTFYTENETIGDFTHTFKATSAISEMEKYYVPNESEYPKSASDVLEEICMAVGAKSDYVVDMMPINWLASLTEPPYKSVDEETGEKEYFTMREIVGYFAGINGGSAFVDSQNRLRVTAPKAAGNEIPQDSMISIKDNNHVSYFTLVYIPQEYEAGTPEAVKAAETVNPKSPNYKEDILVVDFPLKVDTEYKDMRQRLEYAINGMTYESCVVKKQGTGKYELGDFLKCKNPRNNTHYGNIMVMGIVYEISANNGFTETLYSLSKAKSDGTSLTEKVDKVEKKAEESEKKSSGGAIESYIIEAENKITTNGITYTVEKGADGVINKISDSVGNLLIPTVNIAVADPQLHNAVMWATAIARGITGEAPGEYMPYMDGVQTFFTPDTLDTGTGQWWSAAEIPDNLDANITPNDYNFVEGKSWKCLQTKENNVNTVCGIKSYRKPTVSTSYALVKVENLKTSEIGGAAPDHYSAIVNTGSQSIGSLWGFDNQGRLLYRAYQKANRYWSTFGEGGEYLDKYICVATVIRTVDNKGEGSIFINGVKQEGVIETNANTSGVYYSCFLNSAPYYSYSHSFADCNFKFFASSPTPHTDQQIAENCQWIMKKYKLGWKD